MQLITILIYVQYNEYMKHYRIKETQKKACVKQERELKDGM